MKKLLMLTVAFAAVGWARAADLKLQSDLSAFGQATQQEGMAVAVGEAQKAAVVPVAQGEPVAVETVRAGLRWERIHCASRHHRHRHECYVGGRILRVQSVHRTSHACHAGTYGHGWNHVWVSHGCSATFSLLIAD